MHARRDVDMRNAARRIEFVLLNHVYGVFSGALRRNMEAWLTELAWIDRRGVTAELNCARGPCSRTEVEVAFRRRGRRCSALGLQSDCSRT